MVAINENDTFNVSLDDYINPILNYTNYVNSCLSENHIPICNKKSDKKIPAYIG